MVTVKGDVRTVAEKNHVTDIVKSAPGVKDPEKIRAFIRAARSAKVPA